MQPKRKKILSHTAFWAAYFMVTYFNELFLTSDFEVEATINGLAKTFLSEFNLLIIKMGIVYYVIYSFIPRWLKSSKRTALTMEGVCILVLTVLVYRAVIQYVNWQFIFHELPRELSRTSIIARYLYSLLDLLQIIGIAAALRLMGLRIAAAENEKELVREKMRAELGHLKGQINPHFLFNTLNSIYSLSKIHSEKTPDAVNRLSLLLRYMLYESEKFQTSIEEETKIIEDYINLQQLRFGTLVDVQTEVRLDNPSVLVAPLLILPLVENAFKHGVGTRGGNSFIHVDIGLSAGIVQVSVSNSIVTESVKLTSYEGIGLNNIKRQLELLYKDYDLTINDENNCFSVKLTINTRSYVGIELFDSRG